MRVDVLDKVKTLLLIPNTELMTTKMVAAYYEVSDDVIRKVVIAHNEELTLDGITTLRSNDILERLGNDFTNVKKTQGYTEINLEDGSTVKIANRGSIIFTKRAVLRIGMLLRDSEVAQEIRTQLLNIVEKVDDEVKTVEINEKTRLLLAVIQTPTEDERLLALSQLDKMKEVGSRKKL